MGFIRLGRGGTQEFKKVQKMKAVIVGHIQIGTEGKYIGY
jgi:hypothetical protein